MPNPSADHRQRLLPFDVRMGWEVVRVTSDYLVERTVGLALADTRQHSIRIELLPASRTTLGLAVKKIDASVNTVTIVPAGEDMIEGVATRVLNAPNEVVILWPEPGVGWWVIGTA